MKLMLKTLKCSQSRLMSVIQAAQKQKPENHTWKPAQANSSQDPIRKKNHHKKRAGGVVQGVGPEFKPLYGKKNVEDI
jgi:hypothetical protein